MFNLAGWTNLIRLSPPVRKPVLVWWGQTRAPQTRLEQTVPPAYLELSAKTAFGSCIAPKKAALLKLWGGASHRRCLWCPSFSPTFEPASWDLAWMILDDSELTRTRSTSCSRKLTAALRDLQKTLSMSPCSILYDWILCKYGEFHHYTVYTFLHYREVEWLCREWKETNNKKNTIHFCNKQTRDDDFNSTQTHVPTSRAKRLSAMLLAKRTYSSSWDDRTVSKRTVEVLQ